MLPRTAASCDRVWCFVHPQHHLTSCFAPVVIVTITGGRCHLNVNKCRLGVSAESTVIFLGRTVSVESCFTCREWILYRKISVLFVAVGSCLSDWWFLFICFFSGFPTHIEAERVDSLSIHTDKMRAEISTFLLWGNSAYHWDAELCNCMFYSCPSVNTDTCQNTDWPLSIMSYQSHTHLVMRWCRNIKQYWFITFLSDLPKLLVLCHLTKWTQRRKTTQHICTTAALGCFATM